MLEVWSSVWPCWGGGTLERWGPVEGGPVLGSHPHKWINADLAEWVESLNSEFSQWWGVMR